ncbi:hypothetical protein PF005_g4568 [Phytophthora fragariae]|uniref:Uncharacterized protein n=1 Tax=Phytophthora fragariae TaxID=53985 RepID=A0A6A3ULY9_9STRA|nr:hypothetical protein PF003_g1163 [Phytophthora fragariae]KAE8945201.1 hypothetical protein PF009_g5133 [Phytophthora fragariae]KAE9023606.1 hypothetical protein PF011_g3896 [Phytophthora fragariae]KAE9126605.1 hypothetical protein PF007_g5906 [Phytophthora fragariae]KAE9151647.1 hypothetical protein PF006_g4064 [Phytophthora fragariae]
MASFLRVTFPKTDNLKYNNPGTWRCLDFKNCGFWQPAHSVSWVNLSTDHFAMFFESKRCQADGKYVFISAPGLTSSIKRFQTPQSIQSMMIGENRNYTRHPVSITQKCPAHYERARLEATGASLNETSLNATYDVEWGSEDGGLSSNWFDDLSDSRMP